jgi:hypothetical protein
MQATSSSYAAGGFIGGVAFIRKAIRERFSSIGEFIEAAPAGAGACVEKRDLKWVQSAVLGE